MLQMRAANVCEMGRQVEASERAHEQLREAFYVPRGGRALVDLTASGGRVWPRGLSPLTAEDTAAVSKADVNHKLVCFQNTCLSITVPLCYGSNPVP